MRIVSAAGTTDLVIAAVALLAVGFMKMGKALKGNDALKGAGKGVLSSIFARMFK